LAYKIAQDNFVEGGINRVILATDGDFNVGVSDHGSLIRLIESKRDSGVFLSVLGFGWGNMQDDKMEAIANHGNGNYAYIDSALEAERVLVNRLGGTLNALAKDVKLQIEFNPEHVKAYRLIGYENRRLEAHEFRDDTKDAGEIGAGHSVTAFYEIIHTGRASPENIGSTQYRYQDRRPKGELELSEELMTVKLRYKEIEASKSKLIEKPIFHATFVDQASLDFQFATSVVEFGLLLRNSKFKASANFKDLAERARNSMGEDLGGERAEFVSLVRKAQLLMR
jgi:Ca-activated chloride channel homolog